MAIPDPLARLDQIKALSDDINTRDLITIVRDLTLTTLKQEKRLDRLEDLARAQSPSGRL